MDLVKRRAEIVKEHQRLEQQTGSGWHTYDVGAEQRYRANELPLSERPIAFLDDDRVQVVGEDVERILKALKDWLPRGKKLAVPGARGDLVHAVRCVERLLGDPARLNREAPLTLSSQEWNGCLYALTEAGIQVVLTGVTE